MNLPRREYMKDARHCKIYLKRLQFFLDILGNPERKIPHYIHVTGTSGKGSVCAFLHSILQESGKKVGSTQSPHPTYMTERWKIKDKIMTKKEFVDLIKIIKPKLDDYMATTPYDMISYTELMLAISLLYFSKEKVEWAILEVGCGGQYDATNIIPHKDIAIITNIGIDHTNIIGPTKSDIAREKSGIIKKGCEVFTMEKNKKMLSIINEKCRKKSCTMQHITYNNKQLSINNSDLDGSTFTYKDKSYSINVPGTHQINNAILAIEVAKKLKIPKTAIKKGLEKAKQPLRMEIVSKRPLIILDGAHNMDKMGTTVATINQETKKSINQKSTHLIVSFIDDKEWKKMIKLLSTLELKSISCTKNTIHPFRKVAYPKDIEKEFKKYNPKIKTKIFLDPKEALDWSRKQMQKNDILLITGSVFSSGELRPLLTPTPIS